MGTILYTSSVLMTFCNSSAYNVPSRISPWSSLTKYTGGLVAPSDTDSVSAWVTCGKKTPRLEVVFLSQVVILYTVFIVNIYS
jgi:hypothetical protein